MKFRKPKSFLQLNRCVSPRNSSLRCLQLVHRCANSPNHFQHSLFATLHRPPRSGCVTGRSCPQWAGSVWSYLRNGHAPDSTGLYRLNFNVIFSSDIGNCLTRRTVFKLKTHTCLLEKKLLISDLTNMPVAKKKKDMERIN